MSRVLHLIAHDIRSAQNIGSLLRTADSLGVSKLWITGYSPTPAHIRVAKTALGAEKSVAWEQFIDVRILIDQLRSEGFRIVGLEVSKEAIDLAEYHASEKVVVLLGNEREGISPSLLELCDDVIQIAQQGVKESLNVAVAAGIASYRILALS